MTIEENICLKNSHFNFELINIAFLAIRVFVMNYRQILTIF